jgi:pimeloyl-ACP methyl ester carboxylesterase
MFSPDWIAAGPRWFDESQRASLSREFLFPDCDEEALAWSLGTVDLFDTRHLVTQPCPLERWPSVPAASIVATQDRTLTPAWGRRITRRVLGTDAIEIEAGHYPQNSQPAEIASILERLAATAASFSP